MENNKEDMLKRIDKLSNTSFESEKREIISRNKIIRKIFNLIKLPCNGCSICCCNHCGCNVGYWNSTTEGKYFKEELKNTLEKKGSRGWNGFWNKEKGCMLPIEIRSPTCIYHICGNLPAKYGWIRPIFKLCSFDKIEIYVVNNILHSVYDALLIQEKVGGKRMSMKVLIDIYYLGCDNKGGNVSTIIRKHLEKV